MYNHRTDKSKEYCREWAPAVIFAPVCGIV